MKRYDFGEWLMYSHLDKILDRKEEIKLSTVILAPIIAGLIGIVAGVAMSL